MPFLITVNQVDALHDELHHLRTHKQCSDPAEKHPAELVHLMAQKKFSYYLAAAGGSIAASRVSITWLLSSCRKLLTRPSATSRMGKNARNMLNATA